MCFDQCRHPQHSPGRPPLCLASELVGPPGKPNRYCKLQPFQFVGIFSLWAFPNRAFLREKCSHYQSQPQDFHWPQARQILTISVGCSVKARHATGFSIFPILRSIHVCVSWLAGQIAFLSGSYILATAVGCCYPSLKGSSAKAESLTERRASCR